LVEANYILDKMTYAFTNPTTAYWVDTVEEWPGVTTFDATLSGGNITAKRPKHFVRDNSGMHEVVGIEISRPHDFENLGQSEWASPITDRVCAKEADHRQRRATLGITVLGRYGILRQDPFGRPAGRGPRFQISPQIVAK
jgi:hypothetical protein